MRKSSKLEELFAAALALPATERGGYLERVCNGDLSLRAHVKSLLDAFEDGASFIKDRPRVAQSESTGDQIGDYRLLQEIGEGGCGVVYLAEQTAPVKRQVALKIIKLGMDTKAVIARFEAERQALALALMDHPNIAKVFDAGATPAGRPYFVMELVHGIKITEYCDQSRLSIPERLALFTQVSQAIQHAHHKDIIHRDIKPSNVLVTLHDGMPVAKVIDFGIAKATQGRLTDQTLYTAFEQFVGTPAYVSPEQTRPGGIEVDTRSDIYSLGVLLYELLTGCTPFDTAELLQAGLDEMRLRIREEEPPNPSKRLSTLTDEQMTATSARYQTTGAKLVKQVRGDLDWIVMRCLEKERSRRYQTSNDVGLDLQRYLHHEPVIARPPSVAYTVCKFARRHRVVFATGTAIVAVLLIAAAVSTWQAVRATQAEKLAQEVIDFLQNDFLAQASPTKEPDRDLKLRTVLDRTAEKIEGRFAQPLVEASVRETLAATYNSLGEYSTARQHFERALAIYRQRLGAQAQQTLRVQTGLVHALLRQGNYVEAESLGTKTLQLQQQVLGSAHPDTLATIIGLAGVYSYQGKYANAEALQFKALDLRKRVLGTEHPDTLVAMGDLASTYANQGRFTEAHELHVQSLDLRNRVLGPEHPSTLTARTNLAISYSRQGKFAEAEALEIQALEIRKRVLGPEHPDTLVTMQNLATGYIDEGRFSEAIALLSQTLSLRQRVSGLEHLITLRCMNNLAFAYREQERFAEAEALQSQALSIGRRVLGPEHPDTLWFTLNLTRIYGRTGRLAEAELLLTKGLEISRRVLGPEHPDTLEYSDSLGAIQIGLGKLVEAESLLRSSVNGYRKSASNDFRMFAAQSQLGEALVGLHRFADAEAFLIDGYQGLKQRASTLSARHKSEVREAVARILKLYTAWDKPEKVEEWKRRLSEPSTN